jgi:hypothetical protein
LEGYKRIRCKSSAAETSPQKALESHEDASLDDNHSNDSDDEIKSISDSSSSLDSSCGFDDMYDVIGKDTHPSISLLAIDQCEGSIQPQSETSPHLVPPPLDSLIKIIDLSSKYHHQYAQVKYSYSSPKGVYFLIVFIESEDCLSRVDRVMKLTDCMYAYPTAEEAAALAKKFSIGKSKLMIEIQATSELCSCADVQC